MKKLKDIKVKITVARHEVNVGNIGFVYRGTSRMMAAKKYALYVKMSKEGYGRAAGESVVWFVDGEIFKEYAGKMCPYCGIRPVDAAGMRCTECDDMLNNCDQGDIHD